MGLDLPSFGEDSKDLEDGQSLKDTKPMPQKISGIDCPDYQ